MKERSMKRIPILMFAAATAACVVASIPFTAGGADNEAAPIYGIKIPAGYRDWHLISVTHLAGGNLKQLRAQLGNDIAIKAFREGELPFPEGAVIAALHWDEASSDANSQVIATGLPGAGLQSSVAGSA